MLPVIRSTRDSWLPDIFNDFFDNSWMNRPTYTAPAINVIENEKEYDVELAAPGLDKEDFKVHVDEDNNPQSFNCDNTQFQSDPARVDTVVLAEAFHFPTCNYDQNEVKVTLKLQCSILARETSRFSREMYLDCIYLRPRTSKSEEQ